MNRSALRHRGRRRALAALLVGGMSPGEAVAETPESLLRAGDRSARAGRYVEALTAWKQAFEGRFQSFRGRPFRFEVGADFMERDGLRARLLQALDEELPEPKFAARQKAMVAFGFVPPGAALRQTLVDLLTDEIAGFYDPDTKKLYLIREQRAADAHWLNRFLGAGFDPELQKILLAHEMSHALMDQHHDLLSMQRSVEHDDDMSLALAALVEGEATLAMMVVPEGNSELLLAPPAAMDWAMRLATPFVYFSGSRAFRRAPRVLQETLLFPYFKGLTFCVSLTQREASWAPVDQAFAEPPVSTEMVLHPEKYRTDPPTVLWFPDLLPALGPGWTAVHSNVLGELQLRILLSEGRLGPGQSADSAARGWDGDFYRVYEARSPGGAGKLLLAWASTWDSEQDALEAARTYAAFLGGRRARPLVESPADATGTRRWRLGLADGRIAAVLSRGADVWVVDGVPVAAFDAVIRTAFELTRAPKTYRFQRVKAKAAFRPR
jgi:hypothetical protein